MKKWLTGFACFLGLFPAFGQSSRFPPINLFVGDPTGVSCVGDALVQSTTTGLLYTCQGGHYGGSGVTLTTTGTSGPATLTGGALNIPQYAGGSGLPAGGVNGYLVTNSGVAGQGAWQTPVIGTANGGNVILSPYALQCDSSTAATGILDRGKWAVVGSGGSVVIPDLSGTNCGGFYGGIMNSTNGAVTVSRQTTDTFTVYGPIAGLPPASQTSFTIPAGAWANFEPAAGSTTAYQVRITSVPASTTITRSCEIAIVGTNGSGNTAVLQAGDDTAFNASCLNETQTTWTVIGVYCWGDSASNTTTVSPTEGTAGTGSSLLSSALTCGSSKVPAAGTLNGTPTIANGASVSPVMGGTPVGTNIHVLIVYTAVLPL